MYANTVATTAVTTGSGVSRNIPTTASSPSATTPHFSTRPASSRPIAAEAPPMPPPRATTSASHPDRTMTVPPASAARAARVPPAGTASQASATIKVAAICQTNARRARIRLDETGWDTTGVPARGAKAETGPVKPQKYSRREKCRATFRAFSFRRAAGHPRPARITASGGYLPFFGR
ncbi:hypothetical protein DCD74_11480 [Lysobacter oculi]|uniref:Uncharacterized protein n=1 Tax=Solilutibacter oculi TaxID=2698682 RepID=A0A344J855_9GAMM|nr:hypothetical protein DCD74_11480 [Lysobacter oculi]